MLHRLREAWGESDVEQFIGPTEIDETYFGGKEGNKHKSKKLKAGRGAIGKTAVVGAKDRTTNKVKAKVIDKADAKTLHGFVAETVIPNTIVCTDDATAYKGMKRVTHETVKHSVGEYVKGMSHTNGIESFWAMLKRAHKGTFHKISAKHLNRYVKEFAGRHNVREADTINQMQNIVASLVGKRLMYRDLIAD